MGVIEYLPRFGDTTVHYIFSSDPLEHLKQRVSYYIQLATMNNWKIVTDDKDFVKYQELPRYCIENYLIQEGPILDVLYQESPELEKEQLQSSFGFKTWESHNEPLLSELFKIYGITKKIIPTEQTVSYKVSNLCNNNTGEICPIKTQNRITTLKEKIISKIGQDDFDEEYENLTKQIEKSSMTMLHYASGKDYLLPLILKRIRKVIKLRADHISLKIRLAERCDIIDLVEVQKFVFQ